MRSGQHSFWLFGLISLMLLSSIDKNRTYQTECVNLEIDGHTSIIIWNAKEGDNYKLEKAQQDAIHAILYSGVSGTSGCVTQPPILYSMLEQEKFKTIEKSFFSIKGKWSMFVRSSSIAVTLPTSIESENWKVYQVSISKTELRKYLEEQKIIKSLTNGF